MDAVTGHRRWGRINLWCGFCVLTAITLFDISSANSTFGPRLQTTVLASTRAKLPEIVGVDLTGAQVRIIWEKLPAKGSPHVLLAVGDKHCDVCRRNFSDWIRTQRESGGSIRLVFVDAKRDITQEEAKLWGFKPDEVIQVSSFLQAMIGPAELPQTLLVAPTGEMMTVYLGAIGPKRVHDMQAISKP